MSAKTSSSAGTPEQKAVRVLLRAAGTALRARQTGAEPTVRNEADAALQLAFAPVWSRLAEVELAVHEDRLELDGAAVLAAEDDGEGMIHVLRDAGIRRLSLSPGVELEEIKVILSAVAAADPAGGGPRADLQTSLFRADLHHAHYLAAPPEDGTDLPGPGNLAAPTKEPDRAPLPPSEAVRDAVRRDASAAPDTGIVDLEKFDSTLYFLDEREVEYLRSAVDRHYEEDHALNALSVLLDILEIQARPEIRREVIGVLSDLLPELLGSGSFEAVAALISGVREASRGASAVTGDQKAALDRIRASVSRPRAISQLFHALEAGAVAPTRHSMGVLLRELRPTAVRQILAWSEMLSDPGTRAAVVDALDGFFADYPIALSRMLNAPEADVVVAGLDLAARLKLPDFVDPIGDVTSHEDPIVRRAVAATLTAMSSPQAFRHLVRMVDDDDPAVRIAVYSAFVQRPFRGGFAALSRVVTGGELESMGQREKRTLFEAFGSVAGVEAVEILAPLLRGRNPNGPRPSSHTRACVALALGIIGTPGAREELDAAAADRDPLVRSAAGAALRGER